MRAPPEQGDDQEGSRKDARHVVPLQEVKAPRQRQREETISVLVPAAVQPQQGLNQAHCRFAVLRKL